MAFRRLIKCKECSREDYTFNILDYCDCCFPVIEERNKKRWLEDFRGTRTLEERIEQIEEWIYDNQYKLHNHPTF